MGEHNSLKSRILENNPNCFIAGCNCHSAHNAAAKGGDGYTKVTGFDTEDHPVTLYYYFRNSTKRKGILAQFLDFVNLEWEEIICYASTRWLSLESCCDKELRKFPALKAMFLSRDDTGQKFS